VTQTTRIVKDSMIGLQMPEAARWSERVTVVLGLNPGPFTGPGTNTYVIGTGLERLLLDTGQGVDGYLPLLEKSIADVAGAIGLSGIVITHHHIDHVGGLRVLLERFGPLPVYGMKLDARDAGDGLVRVGDGDVVRTEGATLRALWTPGHASDHLCFYLEEERALFTGDVVLGAGTTVIPRDGDLGDYLDSLRRLLALELTVIYPAHGPAIHQPHAKIREYLAHRQLRETQIEEALAQGERTVAEIVSALYTDVPAYLHPAAAMSVEAHLRKLSKEGRVSAAGEHWRRS
jgi:glyoxylase-like metal-dependent hydrolase (beta-lactamase superfamily II)